MREDDRTDEARQHVPADSRVTFQEGRPGGPGVARTIALAHATGPYVKILEADDLLTPGALTRDLAVLEADPELGWATSRALDRLPDKSTVGFPSDPAEGPLAHGALLAHWKAHALPLVVPGTLFVRRELLLALGGGMALPTSEDTGLLLALDAVSRGWFTGEPGLLYRK